MESQLVKTGGNDQYGQNKLFNTSAVETIIVDPLPDGLPRKWEPPGAIVTDQLRVRILDQLQWPNGAVYVDVLYVTSQSVVSVS